MTALLTSILDVLRDKDMAPTFTEVSPSEQDEFQFVEVIYDYSNSPREGGLFQSDETYSKGTENARMILNEDLDF